MKDKDLIEVLTFILKTQREQKRQIDELSHIVTVLRTTANPEQENQIDRYIRSRIPELLSAEQFEDETSRKLDEMLRELDKWADED